MQMAYRNRKEKGDGRYKNRHCISAQLSDSQTVVIIFQSCHLSRQPRVDLDVCLTDSTPFKKAKYIT
jgi:hypothetical protein